jgi:hypothetical protein
VPATYLLIAVIFLINTLIRRPVESVVGLVLALTGIPAYYYWRRSTRATNSAEV